jgi:hypothetical protein
MNKPYDIENFVEFIDNEEGYVELKITEGKYEGIVIRYGDVVMFPLSEDSEEGNIQFVYDVIENPNNVEEDEEFYNFFGILALDVVENYLGPLIKDINLDEYDINGTDEEIQERVKELKEDIQFQREK